MTIESEAMKTALDKFVHAPVDFGRPLVEGESNIARPSASPEQAQAAAFVAGPLAALKVTFHNLVNCEEAGQFSEFFNDVRAKANAGEPLYKLLLGEQIGSV